MKNKMMLILAALMAFAPSSFAQTYDLEEGPMSFEELAPKLDFGAVQIAGSNKGQVVAGLVIGLIAGAIASDALDAKIDARNRSRAPSRDGRWNRPGHRPGPGGRYPAPPPRPLPRPQPIMVACYAQSPYGQVFRTLGVNARVTQNQALMKCAQFSFGCRPAGCQVVSGW